MTTIQQVSSSHVRDLPSFHIRFDNDCGIIALAVLGGYSYWAAHKMLSSERIYTNNVGCDTIALLEYVREVVAPKSRVIQHINRPKTLGDYLKTRNRWTGLAIRDLGDEKMNHAVAVVKGVVINDSKGADRHWCLATVRVP